MRRSRKPVDWSARTALYRFFDADDQLLYVGITVDLKARWQYHSTERAESWWPLVDRRSVEWFENRTAALAAEISAIKNERPLYNVLHTSRNRRPYGNRSGTYTAQNVSRTRGGLILEVIKEKFRDCAFTQMDVLPLVPLCRSAVGQNFRVLKLRGEIVAVGHRTDGRAGLGHTLYALAGTDLALSPEPIHQVSEKARQLRAQRAAKKPTRSPASKTPRTGHGWQYGSYPTATAFHTLSTATAKFGVDRPFSRPDLSQLMGLAMPTIIKHVISLEHHGFIKCVGREPLAGRSGHPPKLYLATGKVNDGGPPCRAIPKPFADSAQRPSSPEARSRIHLVARREFGDAAFTAKQLAEVVGMNPQSVNRNLSGLMSEGLVVQVGWEDRPGPGGRARLFALAPSA